LFIEVDINKISTNPYQPRTHYDVQKLEEITASIKEVGIIQPLLVRERDGYYQLIAGERRFTGAKRAGLKKVPVIVKDVNDEEMLKLALIENLHRDDLSAIDKAMGFKELILKFNITQKRISEIFHLSRPAVANTIRLLDLDSDIREMLHHKKITEGHARALLGVKNIEQRHFALKRIVNENLSVRESEELSRKINKSKDDNGLNQQSGLMTIYEQNLLEEIQIKFGTKVAVAKSGCSGKVEIDFYSNEDLQRILEILSGCS
jgi:ParB family transcriptional regulator, chromosome partitioning protein